MQSHYEIIEVNKYLKRFKYLHKQHIKALKEGNLIYAHEILIEIHLMSDALDTEERSISGNMICYGNPSDWDNLSEVAKYNWLIEKSIIICAYIAGDMKKNSENFFRATVIIEDEVNIAKVYRNIIKPNPSKIPRDISQQKIYCSYIILL